MRAALPPILLSSSLALARAAGAQTGAPTPVGGPAGTAAAPAPSDWTLTFNVQGAYESNVGYGAAVNGVANTGDYLTRGYATLGRRFTGRRSRFTLSLAGGGSAYRDLTQLNNANWGVQLNTGYDFTRRVSGDVQVASSLGYLRDFSRLDAATALAPYTLARYDNATATLRYMATPNTWLTADLQGRRYAFQDTTALTDGKNFVVGTALNHQYASGARLSGIAEYERTAYGPTFEVARLSSRWRRPLHKGWTSELEGGAAAYQGVGVVQTAPGSVDPNELRFAPIVRLTIDGVHGRHTIRLSASRNVGQTYGFGTVGAITYVNASYVYGPVHHVSFAATADASRATGTPVDVPPDGIRLGSALRWQAARRLRFILDTYRWSRRGGTAVPSTTNWDGWAVTLSMASDVIWH